MLYIKLKLNISAIGCYQFFIKSKFEMTGRKKGYVLAQHGLRPIANMTSQMYPCRRVSYSGCLPAGCVSRFNVSFFPQFLIHSDNCSFRSLENMFGVKTLKRLFLSPLKSVNSEFKVCVLFPLRHLRIDTGSPCVP